MWQWGDSPGVGLEFRWVVFVYVLQVVGQGFVTRVFDLAAGHGAAEPGGEVAEDLLSPPGTLSPICGINDAMLVGQVLHVVVLAKEDTAALAGSQEPVLWGVRPVVGALSHVAGPDL